MARRGPLSAAKRKRESDKREKRTAKKERRAQRAEEKAQDEGPSGAPVLDTSEVSEYRQ